MVVWPSMVKMTFTIDDSTADTLRRIANRLNKPQSQVLREAIRHYEPHAGHLTAEESDRRVELFDRALAAIPQRPASETDRELRNVRKSRRTGWQRQSPRNR
jgi:hypothetical protein